MTGWLAKVPAPTPALVPAKVLVKVTALKLVLRLAQATVLILARVLMLALGRKLRQPRLLRQLNSVPCSASQTTEWEVLTHREDSEIYSRQNY